MNLKKEVRGSRQSNVPIGRWRSDDRQGRVLPGRFGAKYSAMFLSVVLSFLIMPSFAQADVTNGALEYTTCGTSRAPDGWAVYVRTPDCAASRSASDGNNDADDEVIIFGEAIKQNASSQGWTSGQSLTISINAVVGNLGATRIINGDHTFNVRAHATDPGTPNGYGLGCQGGQLLLQGTNNTLTKQDFTNTVTLTADANWITIANCDTTGNGGNVLDDISIVSNAPVCSDNVVNGTEQCDDGGNVDGDGCDSSCMIEPGYVCGGMPYTCSLQVVLATPVDNTQTNDSTPAITGTVEPNSVVTVLVENDQGMVIQTLNPIVDGAGNWSIDANALVDGSYVINASATDLSGNMSSDGPNRLIVDLTAPTITLGTPANGSSTNDTTPAIVGTVDDVNATVTVLIKDNAGAVIQTLMPPVDGSGNWTIDANVLTEGAYSAEAVATDTVGNTSAVAGPNTFVVDTTAPSIVLITPSNNSVSNDTTPTISGTTEPGAVVSLNIFDNSLNLMQTLMPMVDGAGNWTIDAAMLPAGVYSVQAVATDAAGNIAVATNIFTIDTVAPTVTITTPADNEIVSNMVSPIGTTETGATVNVVILNGANMEVFNGAATVDGAGNWSIPGQNLMDGVYTIEAAATDAGGNISTDVHTFTVDTTAPAVTLVTPADNAQLTDNTPTLSGATESGAVVTVTIKDGTGATVQTLMATGGANGWTVDAAQLADGTYTAEAVATDAGGNTSMIAGPNTFVVDTTAPSLTLTTPVDGLVTNDNTPSISGNTDDNTATVSVRVKDNSGAIVQTLAPAVDANGDWTVDSAQLPDGDYTVEATATDVAGNTTDAGPNRLTIDTALPTVTLTTPANASFTNDDTPELSGTAEVGTTVEVLLKDDQGNVVETLNPTVDANGDWTIDAAQLAEGTYAVEATSTDVAGNQSPVAGPNTFEVDLTDPSVVVTNPANMSFTSNARPDFSGTTEVSSTISFVLKDDQGNVVHTATVTANAATGAWTVDDLGADLVDGTYTIEATATDRAGNTASTTTSFTVDTTALPLSIDAPTSGQSLADATPDVTGTTAANTSVSLTVTDTNGATVETLMVTSDANGDWSTPLSMLADGGYSVTAEVTNAAGTTSTDNVDFTVDTMAPLLTLDTPADNTQTNDDTPTIGGTSESGVAVVVTITDANGVVVETLNPVVDGMGGWTIDASQLPEGPYTIDAVATDDAGNTTSAGPVNIVVDITAPAIGIVTPGMGDIVATRDVDVTGNSDPAQVVDVEILNTNGLVVDTQTVTTDANGDWTLQTQNLANGDYTIRAKVSDAAGNEASAEQNFTVDSDEALIQITTPVNDSVTKEVRPGITGKADVDASLTVVIKDAAGNDVATFTPMVDANGDWVIALDTDLADGVYTIEATSTRPNGKMATATNTVTIDTAAPTVAIVTPADGMVGRMNQPEISGTSDPNVVVDVTVTNAAGTVVFDGQVTTDDQGNWSITPDAPLADDVYTISATGTDAAGNEAAPVTSGFTVDTNAPSVTVTSPEDGDKITDATPTISGTAEPGAVVSIIIDGEDVGEATADAQGVWTFDVPDDNALGEGEHKIEAKTTDGAGNEGSSGELTVTVEDPKAPVVITSPTEGGSVTGPAVVVTGTGEPGEEVTVTVDGKTQTAVVAEDGSWSVTVDDVTDGEKVITAQSGDESSTVTVTVTAPDATVYNLEGGGCTSTKGSPTSSLWLLALLGFGLLRRRRRA